MVVDKKPDAKMENREAGEGSVSEEYFDDNDDDNDGNDEDDGNDDDIDDSDSDSDTDSVRTTSIAIDQGRVSMNLDVASAGTEIYFPNPV